MPIRITYFPEGKTIQVKPGITVLQAGKLARACIPTRCGGKAGCLMCKVVVRDQRGLTPPSYNERLKLGPLLAEGYRLSCQAKAIGDVQVAIPEDPLKSVVRRQLANLRGEHDQL